MTDAPVLTAHRVTQRFPGVTALDGVDFELRHGEIHALMGENGAGKSTLIKVLTGAQRPDEGHLVLKGQEFSPVTPADAVRLGVSAVYQEVNLLPNLSVAENIVLGRESRKLTGIDWKDAHRRAKSALQRLGMDIDVRRLLGSMPLAVQQTVAIARALDVECEVLVLDEPTSSLDRAEVARLFDILKKLRADGMGIIFVSHFLDQVYEICDRVTVLRNGALVGVHETAKLPKIDLVTLMLGKELGSDSSPGHDRTWQQTSEPLLSTHGLGRRGSVTGIDLTVGKGQIIGLAGLLGSGRSETLRLVFGADLATEGSVSFGTKKYRRLSVRQSVGLGVALCPEDRKSQGLFLESSIGDNLLLVLQARRGWWRKVRRREAERVCSLFSQRLKIKHAGFSNPVGSLSGGNQQKVLLARWLASSPVLMLLDEPTRGIDVGAKEEIKGLVKELAAEGLGVLFVSSEIEEIPEVCDRALVLRDLKSVEVIEGPALTTDRLIETMAEGSDPP